MMGCWCSILFTANFGKHLRICRQCRNFRPKFVLMLRYSALLLLLTLMSCESPEGKISRLQSETLELLSSSDFFVIKTQSQTIKLALPPAPEKAELCAQRVPAILKELNSMDTTSLSAADRQKLAGLKAIVETLAKEGIGSAFDPNKYVVADLLDGSFKDGTGKLLLEKIPEYYTEVERRWQAPAKLRAQDAARQSLRSLDILQKSGAEADQARLAVKDFIGMCQSAACLCE